MPGMNGLEAIVDIKRRYPDTRVLVLTINSTESISTNPCGQAPTATSQSTRHMMSCASRSVAY